MSVISGNTTEVRGQMRYKGPYTPGPKNATARIPLLMVVAQGGGKLNEENPLKLKANQSVEILFDGEINPHTHIVDVQVRDELHECGIVRAVTKVEPNVPYKLYYTTQRSIDLSELDWIISARIVT